MNMSMISMEMYYVHVINNGHTYVNIYDYMDIDITYIRCDT